VRRLGKSEELSSKERLGRDLGSEIWNANCGFLVMRMAEDAGSE
jgi:hypothetical protein